MTAGEFWQEFCEAEGVDPALPYQVWYFGNSEALARELCDLVMQGKKTATAALIWEAEAEPDTAPAPGGYSVVTAFDGTPCCILQTTELKVVPYDEVDEAFAFDEGEGDQSLDYWREVHWDYFAGRCAELGKEADIKMPVICERFVLLYPKASQSAV